jgi:mRNA interferase MazF
VSARRPKRGEIWLIRLDPTEGSEIRKTRPCAIVSPTGMNGHLGTVIIMPMTSGSHPTRFRVASKFRDVQGLLLGDQIRNVSKQRLIKHLGALDEPTLKATLAVLREMFEE